MLSGLSHSYIYKWKYKRKIGYMHFRQLYRMAISDFSVFVFFTPKVQTFLFGKMSIFFQNKKTESHVIHLHGIDQCTHFQVDS